MVSSRGNCEIIEVKDEQSTMRQPQNHLTQLRSQIRDHRPPTVSKKGSNRSLEDDINKLFEAVNLRSAKSLDLSDSRRDPSKKPMRSNGSNSPVIGFSEPVSLKQALRGMCISQAAEMAAIKRSSMPASPRISEVGKITSMYRSVVVESGVSLVEEGSSSSRSKSANQSSCSSPSFSMKPHIKDIEQSKTNDPVHNTLPRHLQEPKMMKSQGQNAHASPLGPAQKVDTKLQEKEKKLSLVSELPRNVNTHDEKFSDPIKKPTGPEKVASVPGKDFTTSVRTVEKSNPKVRRKSKLQNASASNAVKGSKEPNTKATRSNVRVVKPVVKNKNLIIRRSKKVASSPSPSTKTSYAVNIDQDYAPKQLICEKCQCSLRDTGNNNSCNDAPDTAFEEAVAEDADFDAKQPTLIASGREKKGELAVKTNIAASKSCEKGGISQSSKSSFYDFSSSTTSLSDESNLSGSTCGNKPHMSKDARWEAINCVRKQYGFLDLSHFNLLKKLGSGDIGTVYLAELIGTNCPFAIKVMDNEFLERRKKMPRAQTEREILKMLDHPFLPTLYAQFTSDNLSCLVMEFCPGGDLHVLRQKQPGRYFTEQAARFYVAEVLLALEYLHMLGIVYRDLKPENILVREGGHIMLSDFDLSLRCSVNPMLIKSSSLALEPPRISGPCAGSNCIDPFCTGPSCKVSCFTPRIYTSSRARKHNKDNNNNGSLNLRSLPQLVAEPTEARSNSFVGTHEYLAPEIIKGEGHGSAVDWWTLGVFLYELLYGKTPFKGSGNEETLANVVLQNLKFPDYPIVSFQARDLIRGLLVKEPEHRLGTETGAAEIKRHSFFEGLNWALIRCAVPPHVPEFFEVGSLQVASSREASGPKKFMEYGNNGGEHVEFELF